MENKELSVAEQVNLPEPPTWGRLNEEEWTELVEDMFEKLAKEITEKYQDHDYKEIQEMYFRPVDYAKDVLEDMIPSEILENSNEENNDNCHFFDRNDDDYYD